MAPDLEKALLLSFAALLTEAALGLDTPLIAVGRCTQSFDQVLCPVMPSILRGSQSQMPPKRKRDEKDSNVKKEVSDKKLKHEDGTIKIEPIVCTIWR
jgi:hypothetical protein